jgi:hypothetical protein
MPPRRRGGFRAFVRIVDICGRRFIAAENTAKSAWIA